jgi:hypothetical protein
VAAVAASGSSSAGSSRLYRFLILQPPGRRLRAQPSR